MKRVRINVSFQIYRTGQIAGRMVAQAIRSTGMRNDDFAVYSYLLHGPMTLTQLAEGTGLPLTTASGYVQRFLERSHVVKESNPDDGRSRLISLTPAGRHEVLVAAEAFGAQMDKLEEVLAREGFDADALSADLERLQDLIESLLLDGSEKLTSDHRSVTRERLNSK